MNSNIYEEAIETFLGVFLTTAALSLILAINPLINKSNDAIQEPTTIYAKMEQPITEVFWTGAQVKFTLWDIEKIGVPIYVGSVAFNDLSDVRKYIDAIYVSSTYRMTTQKDSEGKVTQINFIYN